MQYERYFFDAFTRKIRAHRRARHRHGDRRIFGDGLRSLCRKLYEKTQAEKAAAGRSGGGNAKGRSGFGIGENGIRIIRVAAFTRLQPRLRFPIAAAVGVARPIQIFDITIFMIKQTYKLRLYIVGYFYIGD